VHGWQLIQLIALGRQDHSPTHQPKWHKHVKSKAPQARAFTSAEIDVVRGLDCYRFLRPVPMLRASNFSISHLIS